MKPTFIEILKNAKMKLSSNSTFDYFICNITERFLISRDVNVPPADLFTNDQQEHYHWGSPWECNLNEKIALIDKKINELEDQK